MFKQMRIITMLFFLWLTNLDATFQVAIPARDFCQDNALILIARDLNGFEQVAGSVFFQDGKTEFSSDEISHKNPTLSSITKQKGGIVADLHQNQAEETGEKLIYLYFEVDADIVRVLVIKNCLLYEDPFEIHEYAVSPIFGYDEDDSDDFGFDDEDDSFFELDFSPVDEPEITPLTLQDKFNQMIACAYIAWVLKSAEAEQYYNSAISWIKSRYDV